MKGCHSFFLILKIFAFKHPEYSAVEEYKLMRDFTVTVTSLLLLLLLLNYH